MRKTRLKTDLCRQDIIQLRRDNYTASQVKKTTNIIPLSREIMTYRKALFDDLPFLLSNIWSLNSSREVKKRNLYSFIKANAILSERNIFSIYFNIFNIYFNAFNVFNGGGRKMKKNYQVHFYVLKEVEEKIEKLLNIMQRK